MREMFIEALTKKYEADVSVAKATISVYMDKSVGIGEHGDVLTEAEKELKVIAEYDDQLQMLDKYFTKKDPFKS